jgi:hypothetical protein
MAKQHARETTPHVIFTNGKVYSYNCDTKSISPAYDYELQKQWTSIRDIIRSSSGVSETRLILENKFSCIHLFVLRDEVIAMRN